MPESCCKPPGSFAVPLHFLPLLPILCSEGLFFLVGRMFPLSAFPVPIGADVFVHRAPVAIREYGLSNPVCLFGIR